MDVVYKQALLLSITAWPLSCCLFETIGGSDYRVIGASHNLGQYRPDAPNGMTAIPDGAGGHTDIQYYQYCVNLRLCFSEAVPQHRQVLTNLSLSISAVFCVFVSMTTSTFVLLYSSASSIDYHCLPDQRVTLFLCRNPSNSFVPREFLYVFLLQDGGAYPCIILLTSYDIPIPQYDKLVTNIIYSLINE